MRVLMSAEMGSEILGQTMKEIQELRAKVELLEQRQEQLIVSPSQDGDSLLSAGARVITEFACNFGGQMTYELRSTACISVLSPGYVTCCGCRWKISEPEF